MSLAIDVDHVSAVLLAGEGWMEVAYQDGVSSFDIDAFEFVNDSQRGVYSRPVELGKALPNTGFTFVQRATGRIICAPLSSLVAVRVRQ